MACHTPTGPQADLLVLRGSIVRCIGNPLDPQLVAAFENDSNKTQSDFLWLGPGLQILLDHVMAVDEDGVIVWLGPASKWEKISDRVNRKSNATLIELSRLEFLVPGMIDLHIHAPQFPYMGTATDRPLTGPDGWLEAYTFPAEARLAGDLALARQVYEGVVSTTLQNGTTTAVYFGSLHLEPNKVLVNICLDKGQRALVGKVCMDRNSPDYYIQSTQDNIEETRELIDYIQEHPKNDKKLVLPLITPRFIPTCTPKLMSALGELAQQYQCHITSHISESIDEVVWSRELDLQDQQSAANGKKSPFDEQQANPRTDATIFEAYGLLTERCIMAHGVHLTDTDLDLLKEKGTAVAHCPLSNFCFAGGILDCQKLMARNNRVGLGTDVAGGYSPSMFQASRMTVVASQTLQLQQSQQNLDKILDFRHAFYLATLGGAKALGMQDMIGTFRVGMTLDAVTISADAVNIPIFPTQDSLGDTFQKVVVLGDDRNITRVFVQGRQVMGKD